MKCALITNYTGVWLERALMRQVKDGRCIRVEYEQYVQAILNPSSELNRFEPDWVFISLLPERILPQIFDCNWLLSTTVQERWDLVLEAVEGLFSLVQTVHTNTNCRVAVSALVTENSTPLGLLDAGFAAGTSSLLAAFNLELQRRIHEEPAFYWVDTNASLRALGDEQSWNTKQLYLTDNPWSTSMTRHLADTYFSLIHTSKRGAKKVMVVDLDNTLWGGVLTEDGPENLVLGPSGVGRVYQDLHRILLNLRSLGILLCVASKNDEREALEAIDALPGGLVRKHHLSAWAISWENKADGLRHIAEQLNLGLSSVVFLDDNPAERSLVAQECPEVEVLPFPDDLAKLPATLASYRGFDRLALTDEDRRRPDLYSARAKAERTRTKFTDLDAFLSSLEMEIQLKPLTELELSRATQLTQKTNQFNMTTQRLTEDELRAVNDAKDCQVWVIGLTDVYIDHGIVGLLIVNTSQSAWSVDAFMMSCRVLERSVEKGVMSFIAQRAAHAGARELRATWCATAKNRRYRLVYQACGMSITSELKDRIEFCLGLDEPIETPTCLRLRIEDSA